MGNKIPNWSKLSLSLDNIPKEKSIFEFTVKTLEGANFSLSSLKGNNATMFVNVASKCKLTPQHYKELVEVQSICKEELPDKKFEILGFPCGQFANQEYNTAEEIRNYVKQYNVQFPLMEKVDVNGDNTHPVFKFLKYHAEGMHEEKNGKIVLSPIEWNFGKFLLDKSGSVVKYYSPKVTPKQCLPDILKVLKGEVTGKLNAAKE